MWLDKRIIDYRNKLNENDLAILEEIKKIPDISTTSIVELADKLHVSKSTVLRLSQKLGFRGFSEFKYYSGSEKETNSDNQEDAIKEDVKVLLKKDILQSIKLAEKTNFDGIVSKIRKAKIIYCFGTGNAQRKALEEFARLLITIDKRAFIIPAATELRMTIPTMSEDDLLIICSLSGNVTELKPQINELKEQKIPIIGLSKFSQNYLEEVSDDSYFFYSTEILDTKKNRIRSSLTGLNVLLDWIYRECFTDYLIH